VRRLAAHRDLGRRVICGVRARVHGHGEPARHAVILLPKHQSTWETFAFPTLMPHPLAYVFKRELLYIPFFGWAMARMDMIHIDRSKRAEAWNQGGRAGPQAHGQGQLGHHVPRRHARARGKKGTYKAGGTRLAVDHRPAGGADRRHLGALLAAQELSAAPGRGRRVDRQADRLEGREPDELMREVEAWIEARCAGSIPRPTPKSGT
jgi:1-acyl-sn-glycerol-3-phosphate acyltransferase